MTKEYTVFENSVDINILGQKQQAKILNAINIKEIRKKAFNRDKFTCQCCKRGGDKYRDLMELHHIVPLEIGGDTTEENSTTLCVACHRFVHLYSTGDLYINKALSSSYDKLTDEQKKQYTNKKLFEDEKRKFKRIVILGSIIRKSAEENQDEK